jgi:hypothetical protein
MRVKNFPECCGLKLVHGWHGNITDKGMQRVIDRLFEESWGFSVDSLTPITLNAIAVLTSEQEKEYKEKLRAYGFRKIYRFYNPNTQGVLGIFFRDSVPELSPANPKFDKEKYEVKAHIYNPEYLTVQKRKTT